MQVMLENDLRFMPLTRVVLVKNFFEHISSRICYAATRNQQITTGLSLDSSQPEQAKHADKFLERKAQFHGRAEGSRLFHYFDNCQPARRCEKSSDFFWKP